MQSSSSVCLHNSDLWRYFCIQCDQGSCVACLKKTYCSAADSSRHNINTTDSDFDLFLRNAVNVYVKEGDSSFPPMEISLPPIEDGASLRIKDLRNAMVQSGRVVEDIVDLMVPGNDGDLDDNDLVRRGHSYGIGTNNPQKLKSQKLTKWPVIYHTNL